MELFKKYWFILVIVAIVIGAYVAVRKGVFEMFSSKTDEEKQAEEELSKLTLNSNNLTITRDDAILICQQLLAAMDGIGTDEDTIFRLLNGLSHDDLILLIKTFGLKYYADNGQASTVAKWVYASNLNLIGWLKRELSGNDLKQVEQIFISNQIPF